MITIYGVPPYVSIVPVTQMRTPRYASSGGASNRTLLARPGFSFNSRTLGGNVRDTAALPRFDLDGGRVGEVGLVPMGDNGVFSIGGSFARSYGIIS